MASEKVAIPLSEARLDAERCELLAARLEERALYRFVGVVSFFVTMQRSRVKPGTG